MSDGFSIFLYVFPVTVNFFYRIIAETGEGSGLDILLSSEVKLPESPFGQYKTTYFASASVEWNAEISLNSGQNAGGPYQTYSGDGPRDQQGIWIHSADAFFCCLFWQLYFFLIGMDAVE